MSQSDHTAREAASRPAVTVLSTVHQRTTAGCAAANSHPLVDQRPGNVDSSHAVMAGGRAQATVTLNANSPLPGSTPADVTFVMDRPGSCSCVMALGLDRYAQLVAATLPLVRFSAATVSTQSKVVGQAPPALRCSTCASASAYTGPDVCGVGRVKGTDHCATMPAQQPNGKGHV